VSRGWTARCPAVAGLVAVSGDCGNQRAVGLRGRPLAAWQRYWDAELMALSNVTVRENLDNGLAPAAWRPVITL